MSTNRALEQSYTTNGSAAVTDHLPERASSYDRPNESLFEEMGWLYAVCRERLFRDDTDCIATALWRNNSPADGTRLIELGCGPGLYARQLALRFPQVQVVGVDRSLRQIMWAKSRARRLKLRNCKFVKGNALSTTWDDSHFDYVVASRLFTVLSEPARVVAEMHRLLRPGGKCLVAEPRSVYRASIPLIAMRICAAFTHFHNGYREPHCAQVLESLDFVNLFTIHPWKKCHCWRDKHYQYAVCEKA